MNPARPARRSVLPVLYIGGDLTPRSFEVLRSHCIGVIAVDDSRRARRLLSHFRVAAIVFAAPDLPGLNALGGTDTPVIVLAARDAVCDLDGVTIVRRGCDLEELAAIIHGVARRAPIVSAARHAA